MESDDDFEVFTHPANTPSPVDAAPKMKRLKKLSRGLLKESVEIDAEVAMDEAVVTTETADVDFGGAEDLVMDEIETETEKEAGDLEDAMRFGHGSSVVERELSAKRALDFESADGEGGDENLGEADLEMDGAEKRLDVEEVEGKEKRKKRSKPDGEELEISKSVSKKRSEKERREHLNQLHAESQRLLRETRDAGFKPAPVVHKPISSVLEKIRKRKLELRKKTVSHNSTNNVDDDDDDLRFCKGVLNPKSESILLGRKTDAELPEQVNEGENRDTLEVECSLKEASVNRDETTDEEPASLLRAPLCDTQDLFCDSKANESKNEMSAINEDASPSEENFVPSVLAMNLRFDSALPDDDDDDNNEDDEYSDEEENDKENVAPHPPMPRDDPVQAFVDDEAVEEDDSDDDQLRFQENEDEDDIDEDAEDVNEMIATDYEENQVDQERRQELHMKMLEQQDAEGIENLLQKYKCESKLTVLRDEDYTQEDESCDEALETEAPKSSLRLCVKKAKQMIVHMFTDNEDVYVSSEDEELGTRVVNRVIRKSDEKKKLTTPDRDESSREVFGLIKKLNIASEMKKKAKFSSFDTITSKSISSSKPSFMHRTSSNSLPSSRKHGSSVTRAFVFARDDSNSRSSIAVSEDPETVQNEVQQTTRSTAKFSQSQSKQKSKEVTETVAGTSSLFEMLRRSAVQSHSQDGIVGRTDSVFASFKLPKRSILKGSHNS